MKKARSERKAQKKLELIVGSKYTRTDVNYKYYNKKHGNGEVDYFGLNQDGTIDIYEIKTRKKRSLIDKAMNQIKRARCCLKVSNAYIYFSDTEELERVHLHETLR